MLEQPEILVPEQLTGPTLDDPLELEPGLGSDPHPEGDGPEDHAVALEPLLGEPGVVACDPLVATERRGRAAHLSGEGAAEVGEEVHILLETDLLGPLDHLRRADLRQQHSARQIPQAHAKLGSLGFLGGSSIVMAA